MEKQTLIGELVGGAYPPAIAVGTRVRRNWIARSRGTLPDEPALSGIARATEEDAFAKIRAVYGPITTAEQLAGFRPSVTLVRLDAQHLVVRVEFADPGTSPGDIAATAQWGILQEIDRQIGLEDLQGIPCEHWFPLRAGRSA